MDPSNSICRRENSFLSIHLQKFRRIVPLFLCYELMHFSVKYLSLLYSLFVSSLFYFAILFDRKILHSKFLCFRFRKISGWSIGSFETFFTRNMLLSRALFTLKLFYFEILETWILFPFGFTKISRWLISWFEIFRNFLSS